jgi:hypothetical protein
VMKVEEAGQHTEATSPSTVLYLSPENFVWKTNLIAWCFPNIWNQKTARFYGCTSSRAHDVKHTWFYRDYKTLHFILYLSFLSLTQLKSILLSSQ